MGLPTCNTTLEDMRISETPMFGTETFTFHRLIIVISAVCGLIAVVVSFFLMFMHATHYSRPTEQRHTLRILFMVPIYATVSFLSIVFYYHSVYYEVLRDCYEAFAIASFFNLLCAFVGDNLHDQKEYFRKIKPRPWVWPISSLKKCAGGEGGWLRTPRSGLTWFNVIFVAVFQYCFIRVAMTITAVLTQHWDRYCLESLNPAFAHVWVMVVEAIAVTIAMYNIIQFYIQLRLDIAQHKPFQKVLAIKLVIFLSFWQTIILSFLTSSGAIKSSPKIGTPDIKVGIPSLLLCIEMPIFAVFHLWSFTYKPYVIGTALNQQMYGHLSVKEPRYYGGPAGIKAFAEAFNPWDIIKAVGRSAKWLFRDRKNRMQDASYASIDTAQPVQKMNELDSSPTSYDGSAVHPQSKPVAYEEGSRLLNGAQPPAQMNPYTTASSDSTTNNSWTEVESKEYMQDQQMRREHASRDEYQTAHVDPYNTNSVQQTGVLRPAGTSAQQTSPQDQHLPMVTKQDIQDMRQGRQNAAPYPSSTASGNPLGDVNTSSMPQSLRPGGRSNEGRFI